jgi:hypothetical protein
MRFRSQAAAFLLAGTSLCASVGASPFGFGFENTIALTDVAMSAVVSALLLFVMRGLAPILSILMMTDAPSKRMWPSVGFSTPYASAIPALVRSSDYHSQKMK